MPPNFKLSPNGGKMRSRGIFNPRWYRAIMCFLMVLAYAGAVDVESDTDVIESKVRVLSERVRFIIPFKLLTPCSLYFTSLRYGG